ncbi:MAG: esterase [Sphingobacteriales bacterium]|nr:esterase [Sphingobacteriales bacterium]
MKEQYIKWHSPNLSGEIDCLVFGDRGLPVIAFPTSMGSVQQNKDFGLIGSAWWFVQNGLVKIYSVGAVDKYSWYNKKIHPAERVKNHMWYDRMIYEELVPRCLAETGHSKVATAGCSFGGYHATNFGFRHPDKVRYILNMGAAFDIRSHLNGYYDENVYFNNPTDFMPHCWDDHFRELFVFLGVGEHDFCLDANQKMSNLLTQKNIGNWLDVRPGQVHDWPAWREMFPHYLSLMTK